MRRLEPAALERFVAASPLRIRLVDMHTNAPPKYPVSVSLERVDAAGTQPLGVSYKITATGIVSFVGLAQSHTLGTSTDVRVKVEAPGTISETATGTEWFEATVASWTSAAPPAVIDGEFRFFPAPNYRFAPGLAIANGQVVDAAAVPVPRAAVSRSETVNGTVLVEECRTDELGNFRLPLRWSDGATVISAQLGAASGTTSVVVPAGLVSQVLITIT